MHKCFVSCFDRSRYAVLFSRVGYTLTRQHGPSKSAGLQIAAMFLMAALLLGLLAQPAKADAKRIAIVYSQETATHYFDAFAYGQLFAAIQHQATMAGIPFDLLSASDLTDAQLLMGYDALAIPLMTHVATAQLPAIEAALTQAVNAGVGIVTAGGFLTLDENNQAFPGNPYATMEQILGVGIVGGAYGVAAAVTVADVSHPATRDYTLGEVLHQYDPIWFNAFAPVPGQAATILTQMTVDATTYNGAIVLQRGGRIAHFASEQIMMDNNLLWSVLQWIIYGNETPVGLKLSRNDSIFLSRNDMDQSMFFDELHLTEVPLYDLLSQWKQQYNFVGSYYINIGNRPNRGEFTDWTISAPLYQNYIALGNEIGTHSWTHPDNTSLLSPAELEFEFNQSALEIGNQLGTPVLGVAIPGNPETLEVVEQINQWLPYMSGRAGIIGSGYRGAFGSLTPDHQMLYFSLNMSPDFTLIGVQGQTPAASEQIWRNEIDALRLHASQPIIHWMWHDYGPTIEPGYNAAMYENTIAYAFNAGVEFATLADMQGRMRNFQQATLEVNDGGGLTVNVAAGAVGQFSLQVHSGDVIESVTGWYAYDDDQVFLPEGGGQFPIQLGSSAAALTRITALPMRARLLSVTGNGSELAFSFEGEGEVTVRLHPSLVNDLAVTGASSFSQDGDTLTMQFASFGAHNVTLARGAATNQAPTADAQAVATAGNPSIAIVLTGSDPDGDALAFQVISGPTHGSLSGTAPMLTYTPTAGYTGPDSFSFVVNDGAASSAPATVSIDVQQGNTQPVANAQSLSLASSSSIAIMLTGSDADGDALTFQVTSGPSHGSLSGVAPALTYTPAAGYTGSDSFSFVVNDGAVNSLAATITLAVQAVNDGSGLVIDGNLSDWSGLVSFGLDPDDVSGTNNLIDWREAWMAHDATHFYLAYQTYDPAVLGWGLSAFIDTDDNTATGFSAGFPIGADYLLQGEHLYQYTGSGADWSWSWVGAVSSSVAGDSVELTFPRSLIGDPTILRLFFLGDSAAVGGSAMDAYPDAALDANAPTHSRSFPYTALNTPTNTKPVANDQSLLTVMDTSIVVLLTGSDADGDALTFQVTSGPSHGSLSGVAPALTYTPAAGYTGSDSFSFVVNDGAVNSLAATITLAVQAVNDGSGLVIDGNLSDWSGLVSFGTDPDDVSGTNNLIDWREAWMAHDATHFYLAYQTYDPAVLGWGLSAFIDTDDNTATGFSAGFPIGADYLLQGEHLYQYTGSGADWSWSWVGAVSSSVAGDSVELTFPRSLIGDPTILRLFFLGDSAAVGGSAMDAYPDAALDANAPTHSRSFPYIVISN